MKVKTKTKKPLLSAKHMAYRLRFAKDHVNWAPGQSKLVTWSNETKICITSNNIQNKLKYGGGSLMIWGCFQRKIRNT